MTCSRVCYIRPRYQPSHFHENATRSEATNLKWLLLRWGDGLLLLFDKIFPPSQMTFLYPSSLQQVWTVLACFLLILFYLCSYIEHRLLQRYYIVVRQIHSGIRLGTKRWVMDRLGLLNSCDYWFKTSAVQPTLINHYVVLNYLLHLQLVTVWQPFCKRSCDVNYRKIKCKQLYFFEFTSKHFWF